ncbi:MAG: SCO family protein [Tateyamaria sp.]|uniref:SCO family protein n=1 Tax=Tateyamaria sp. TaxID=1929288 RepID=UPI00329DFD38
MLRCAASIWAKLISGQYWRALHTGRSVRGVRTEVDANSNAQLVFFGCANCLNIRSAALRLMAQDVDVRAEDGIDVTPVMITAAQHRDRGNAMSAPLADIHPEFVGLARD